MKTVSLSAIKEATYRPMRSFSFFAVWSFSSKNSSRRGLETDIAPPRVRSRSLWPARASRSLRMVILETPNSLASSSAETDLLR